MINGKQITADIILKFVALKYLCKLMYSNFLLCFIVNKIFRHIPMKDIPINDEENSNFLMDLYYEKVVIFLFLYDISLNFKYILLSF